MLGHVFHFASIRKITAAFGNLFKGIQVVRYSNNGNQGVPVKTISCALKYGPTAKWLALLNQKVEAGSAPRVKISLPIISFQMSGAPQYDSSRKLITTVRAGKSHPNTSGSEYLSQMNPVPVDIPYEVNIATKYYEDGLQIIEQIIPFFTQSFNLTINDMPQVGIVRDVPVILAGMEVIDDFEGSVEEDRICQWRLSFVAKGYIYPPIRDAELIKKVISTLYGDEALTNELATITVEVNPMSAGEDDVYDIETTIEEE